MNSIRVRRAIVADIPIITAFNQAMALETENKSLHRDMLIDGVQSLFSTPQYGFYLVAELVGRHAQPTPAACLMITYEWSDWRNGVFWWIQSVYVAPEARRRGVFTALYRHVHQLASDDANACGIRLYVERGNARAQNIYSALGMYKTNYHLYEVDFRSGTQ